MNSTYRADVPEAKHFALKAKIKGMAQMGSDLSAKAQKIKKTENNPEAPWNKQRSYLIFKKRHQKLGLAKIQRHHLIAYGLLKGIPYERIEVCAEHNKPDPLFVHRIIQEHINPWRAGQWTAEKVILLLKRKASEKKAA